jgi:hypothetical protein
MGDNEYYAAEKIARKVVSEEIEACPKGIKHEGDIDYMKKDIIEIKENHKGTTDKIFILIDRINGKFLTVAGMVILELVGIVLVLLKLR